MAVHRRADPRADTALSVRPQFAQLAGEVPRDRLPPRGMPADTASQVVTDEFLLDGNARLNLATFVTTWSPSCALLVHRSSLGSSVREWSDRGPRPHPGAARVGAPSSRSGDGRPVNAW